MTLFRPAFTSVMAALVVAALSACGDGPSAAEQAPPTAQTNPDQVVAEVQGRKVTLKEVDAKWEEFDAAERARVTQMLYQNRRNMLGQLVGDILIENAAKAANLSVDAYLKQESAKWAQPVTEEDLVKFFNENKDRTQGRSLDELRGPMKDFIESQRTLQARAQIVDELERKAGGIKVLLDPPRYTLAVQPDDPVRGESTAAVTLVEFSDYQ